MPFSKASFLLLAWPASTAHAFSVPPTTRHSALRVVSQQLPQRFSSYSTTTLQLSNATASAYSLLDYEDQQQPQLEEAVSPTTLSAAMMTMIMVDPQQQQQDTTENPVTLSTPTTTTTQKEPLSDVVKARLLLLGAAALYGTNFSLVKLLGETGLSVGLASTLRFGMAALVTLPWLLQIETSDDKDNHVNGLATTNNKWSRSFHTLVLDKTSKEHLALMGGLEVGMWNAIGYVAQAVGLETTSASKSAFLCSLAVVMVPLLDYLAGKQLLTRQVLGATLAVVGVGFLELEGLGGGGTSGGMAALSPGDIASLVQPIAFGLGFWRMEAAMKKCGDEAERATAAQLFAVFLGSAAYMGIMGAMDPSTLPSGEQFVSWVTDPVILGALFWTGVVTTALTIYMETVALKTLSAAETTLIFSTEPLWGTAFASVVMGETLGLNAVAGAFMILSGCVVSNLEMNGLKIPEPVASLLSRLPGQQQDKDKSALEWEPNQPTTNSKSFLPTGALGKFSLKSGVAGALTGVVASIAHASSKPIIPDEVQDFFDNLPPPS